MNVFVNELALLCFVAIGVSFSYNLARWLFAKVLHNRHERIHTEQWERGVAAFEAQKYQEASQEVLAILECPKCDKLEYEWSLLGYCFQMQGQYQEALHAFERALEIEPNNPRPMKRVAYLLACAPVDALRNGERAKDLAAQAFETTGDGEALSILAAAEAELGQFEVAIKHYQEALELMPKEQRGIRQDSLKRLESRQPFRCNPEFDRSRTYKLSATNQDATE